MDKEVFRGGELEWMENIFDLKLESLGRKTAHTGNPKMKDTENFLKTKANSLLKFWQFGQK